MSWLVWRQYRLQAAAGAILLAGFAAVIIASGVPMASQWHTAISSCATAGGNGCGGVALGEGIGHDFVVLSLLVPAILGIFWGAPLVAYELESGTSQHAWTQTVTRTRWLTVKAGWLLLAAAAWGGAVAALVTWWSGPPNAAFGTAFQPSYFDVEGIVPVGYAVFATALGIAAGTLLRRTQPAIAVTHGGFVGLRLLTDSLRPHYMTAVTAYYSMTGNFSPPSGSWSLTSGVVSKTGQVVSEVRGTNVDGVPLSALSQACQKLVEGTGTDNAVRSCINSAGFRQYLNYQPANRLWAFQGVETGIYVLLAAALLAVTYMVVRRRDA